MIRRHRPLFLGGLVCLLALLCAAALTSGPVGLSAQWVLEVIVHKLGGEVSSIPASMQYVVWELRFPRLLLACLVGAALACAGAAIQGLFRNPLADPGLIGVASGAALGAVSVIVLGASQLSAWVSWAGAWALPGAAFLGGLTVTLVTYRIATRAGETHVAVLLLCGIAINVVAGAATGLLIYLADDAQLRTITFWSMGSLAQATWQDVLLVAPLILCCLVVLPFCARTLNGMLLGENVAGHLGLPVVWVKRGIIVLTALLVGGAVAVSGLIGFIGLVVPHMVRLLIGPDHRFVLPGAMLGGAVLLVAGDWLARTLVAPAELPIGLIMSLIGGPFFLFLLLGGRRIQAA